MLRARDRSSLRVSPRVKNPTWDRLSLFVYRVIVTVQPQFADTNSSPVHTGREKPRSTVRELLSRPDNDLTHSLFHLSNVYLPYLLNFWVHIKVLVVTRRTGLARPNTWARSVRERHNVKGGGH